MSPNEKKRNGKYLLKTKCIGAGWGIILMCAPLTLCQEEPPWNRKEREVLLNIHVYTKDQKRAGGHYSNCHHKQRLSKTCHSHGST